MIGSISKMIQFAYFLENRMVSLVDITKGLKRSDGKKYS